MIYTIGVVLFVLASILMVVVILMQASKGGGLSASFGGVGGAGGVMSSRGAANFLQKATIMLALLYGLLCLFINKVGEPVADANRSVVQEQLDNESAGGGDAVLPLAPVGEPIGEPAGGSDGSSSDGHEGHDH